MGFTTTSTSLFAIRRSVAHDESLPIASAEGRRNEAAEPSRADERFAHSH